MIEKLKERKVYVISHAGCSDGMGASFAAWKLFGDKATYIFAAYQQPPPPIDDGSVVYVLDFSFPKEIVEELAEKNQIQVLIVDHHVTAKDDLSHLPTIDGTINDVYDFPAGLKYDAKKSGAWLAWEFFHPGTKIPALIEYVADRDLWLFEKPLTKIVGAYLWVEDRSFENWDRIAKLLESPEGTESIVAQGSAIIKAEEQTVKMICSQAFKGEICGHQVMIVNATSSWSDVGHELVNKYPETAFSATYNDTKEGKRKWSFRSKPGFDVSAVAKSFGGGGHPCAAGAVLEKDTIKF